MNQLACWQEIDVYVALADGLDRHDASAHATTHLVTKDLRSLTGIQDYVATAPVNLLYVVDFSRMGEVREEDRLSFAATDAAVIAENVYLFCAARGLATVVRGLVDRKKLAAAMGLRKDQRIVLAQSVGFPAAKLGLAHVPLLHKVRRAGPRRGAVMLP